jgi:murein L,D-transpeptidase YafK
MSGTQSVQIRVHPWLILLLSCSAVFAGTFQEEQLRHARVRAAAAQRGQALADRFCDAGLAWPPREIFLRAFKVERELELWARNDRREAFRRVATFPICSISGRCGPKRRQGDMQIPEGCYHIQVFNPWSRFHLSLGLNYPNTADRRREGPGDLGGDIFIHGSCVTIGCLPLTDPVIEEVYLAAVAAADAGQQAIPVHIFPLRFSNDLFPTLAADYAYDPSLLLFWQDLRSIYDHFERHHRLPAISIDDTGRYRIAP